MGSLPTASASSPHGSSASTPAIPTGLLATLALLSAAAPLGTDLYLAALPGMTTDLGTSDSAAQLTLTGFLLGLASGQLLFGPLSDRFGRRGPLLIGVTLSVVFGIVAALAPTVEILVIARVLQGLGGSAGIVLSRAIIADRSSGTNAAKAFSLMMTIGGVAPVVAPLIGSLFAESLGWRGLLWIVTAVSTLSLVLSIISIAESHPAKISPAPTKTDLKTSKPRGRVLSRGYLANVLTLALSFGVMMGYISASPFFYQNLVGLNEIQYGLAFGLNALALMGMGALATRLVSRVSPRRIQGIGVTIMIVAVLVLLAITLSGIPLIWAALPIIFTVGSLGFIMGPSTSLALGYVRGNAGTASAIMGCVQLGVGAAISPLVGAQWAPGGIPMATTMLAAACLAIVAYLSAPRKPLFTENSSR